MSDTLNRRDYHVPEANPTLETETAFREPTIDEIAQSVIEHGIYVEESLVLEGLVAAVLTRSREGGIYLLEASGNEPVLVSRLIQPDRGTLTHGAKTPVLSRHKTTIDSDLIIGQSLTLNGTSHNSDRLKHGTKFTITPIVSAQWIRLNPPSR